MCEARQSAAIEMSVPAKHGHEGASDRSREIGGMEVAKLPPRAVAAVAITAAVAMFVSYMLWPTWPKSQLSLDAPAIPVIVASVLFNVPPAAVRPKMQRQPGAHERMDLVFLWPALTPPSPDALGDTKLPATEEGTAPPEPHSSGRLFVTITSLGAVLPPLVRLRTIYPRYIESQATAGPDGLAIVPFRPGTPYEGEDLIYFADVPDGSSRSVPGRRAACRAPAFRSASSTRQLSRCASRALGSKTGATPPPVSTVS